MMRILSISLGVFVFMATAAQAESTESITSNVQTTNHTGVVIDADQTTGHAPDRSVIMGAFTMEFVWDYGANVSTHYDGRFWFEDQDGTVLPIIDAAGGATVTELSHVYLVNLNLLQAVDTHTFTVAFRPATRLLPNKRYTLKAKWAKQPSGGSYGAFTAVPLHADASTTETYYYFTNTVSNDAATNAQVAVTLHSWIRPWMIAGSPSQGSFQMVAEVKARRYDGFLDANSPVTVPIRLVVSLKNAGGTTVWTSPTPVETGAILNSYAESAPPASNPSTTTNSELINFLVPAGVLTLGETYTPVIAVTHDDGAGYISDGSATISGRKLMRLDGTLSFGTLVTVFDQLSASPATGMVVVPPSGTPDHAVCTFMIPENHGIISSSLFYSGTLQDVTVYPDGHATYGGDDYIPVTGTGVDITVGGVTISRSLNLAIDGPTGIATIHFPDGFRIAADMQTAIWDGEYVFDLEEFTPGLPLPGLLSIPGDLFCHCDQLPLYMQTSNLTFDTTTGRFTLSGTWRDVFKADRDHISAEALAGRYVDPLAGFRPSNMLHFACAEGDAFTAVQISADAAGRAQFHAARVDFGSGYFAPHFPLMLGTGPSATTPVTGGLMTINEGAIAASSTLTVGAMTLAYVRDMATGPCATNAGPGGLLLTPSASFSFTADGGLVGETTIDSPTPVQWGALPEGGGFAHQLPLFATASFHMPGHWLGSHVCTGIERDQRSVAMLFTGVGKPGSPGYTERPDDSTYWTHGEACYAGITLRGAGGGTAVSTLAGVPTTYDLTASSRYYLRPAGITGITDAAAGFTISPVYGGMGVTLSNFRLAFMDNLNVGSASDGSLHVGSGSPAVSPVDLNFAFAKLFFGPQGQLTNTELSPAELVTPKTLRYWQTDFTPKAMAFRQPVPLDGSCPSPGEGFLSLAIEATLPLLPGEKVHGVIGFKGNGDLLGKGDALTEGTGIDSRFQLPANVQVAAGSGTFTLQPVVRAYLNRWEAAGVERPATGFLSVAGRLGVPFFEAMKLHLHADSQNNVFFMGGWAVSDTDGGSLGWSESGNSFFNKADFDPLNIGFPGTQVGVYRNDGDATYNPRVFKNWFKMVDFDYTLKRGAGGFDSVQPRTSDLLLFTLKNKVTRLTPSGAEINFDASLAQNVPDLSVSSLISSTGLVDGIAAKFSTALGGFNVADLTAALDGLDGLVRDTMTQSLGTQIEAGMSPVVDAVYAQLQSSYAASGNTTGTALATALQEPALVTSVSGTAQAAVSALVSGAGTGLTLNAADRVGALKTQAQTLASGVSAISNVAGLASATSTIAGGGGGPGPGQDVADTLLAASTSLNAMVAEFQAVETTLRTGSGDLFSELGSVATDNTSAVTGIATNTLRDVAGMVLVLNAEDGQLFTAYPEAEMKRRIRNIVRDHFFGSRIASEYQRIFKSYLNPLREGVALQTDQIMAELEAAARAKLEVPVVEATALGSMASALKSNGLRGFARINGNSLETLRLDGEFNLNILSSSDEARDGSSGMSLKAWMEVKAMHSDSPPSGGNPLGGSDGLTVELGAKDVPIHWGIVDGKAYASVKFGFDMDAHPLSFDGCVGLDGGFNTGGFQFIDPKVVVGAGPSTLYGGLALRAAFNGKEVAARILLGSISGLTPLQIIDPKAADVLQSVASQGQPDLLAGPLLGGSLYAEAWYPLNELIGIPTTSLINLRAGLGGGFMCWKPLNTSGIIVGTQQFMGLSGEVLCMIEVGGSLTITGAGILGSSGDTVIGMKGIGEVHAEIGVCPFCEDFSKSISATATFNLSTGKITNTGFDF